MWMFLLRLYRLLPAYRSFVPFRGLAVDLKGVIGCCPRLLAPAFSRLTASIALSLAYVACAASPACRCKRSHSAFILLSCALAMLIAANPAHAQGTVTGATITTSVSTVTVPVNTPATFTATVTGATPNPDQYWTVIAGPTYSWGGYGTHDPATTTISQKSSQAGTYTVSPLCNVSYTVQYARGATATISMDAKLPQDTSVNPAKDGAVTINVIGGPISGENDIYWFCQSNTSTDWGHLSAATGQPTGTTYSWSLAGTGAQLTSSSTSASVTYCGAGAGSTKPGDVTATVTYRLNGVSATSPPFPITVHAPASFVLNNPSTDAYTKYEGPGPSDVWGFDKEHLYDQGWLGPAHEKQCTQSLLDREMGSQRAW